MKQITDIHTHTSFSADGISSMEEMLGAALEKGIAYYGISEHFDLDYEFLHLLADGKPVPMTDADAYFTKGRKLQTELKDRITLLLGCEFGFHESEEVQQKKAAILRTYAPDFIVNSVHTVDGFDCWFEAYFSGKTKETAYRRYLERVYESLFFEPYDIVAHIGYVARNAPYPDPKLRYDEHREILDRILKEIIRRGKILEVNSSSRTAGSEFLPDTDILKAYYDFGGRKISFASDAHRTEYICSKRETVVAALQSLGFTYVTVPCRGTELKIEL